MPRRSSEGERVKVSEASVAQLERYRGELQRDLEKLKTEDSAEKEELRRRLDQAESWIEDRKKADADRDKVKEDSTTIVVPPNTVAPSGRPENQPTNEGNSPSGSEGKRGGWKRWV